MPITNLDLQLMEELRQLYEALPALSASALAALKNSPTGALEGPALARFRIEDAKLSTAVRRIKEIHAVAGEPWNA